VIPGNQYHQAPSSKLVLLSSFAGNAPVHLQLEIRAWKETTQHKIRGLWLSYARGEMIGNVFKEVLILRDVRGILGFDKIIIGKARGV
jgi:uncharacterized lipoprotein YddW (UPF0748 family)